MCLFIIYKLNFVLHMLFFFFKDMYISCNGDPKYRSSPVLGVQPKKQQSVSILEEKPTILSLL